MNKSLLSILILCISVPLSIKVALGRVRPDQLVTISIAAENPLAPVGRFLLFRFSEFDPAYVNPSGQNLIQYVFLAMNDKRVDQMAAWDVAEFLVERGVSLDHCDDEGYSALHGSVADSQQRQVEFLLNNGARINNRCAKKGSAIFGATPYGLALEFSKESPARYSSIVAILKTHGAME